MPVKEGYLMEIPQSTITPINGKIVKSTDAQASDIPAPGYREDLDFNKMGGALESNGNMTMLNNENPHATGLPSLPGKRGGKKSKKGY
jgi:hypothetical protein